MSAGGMTDKEIACRECIDEDTVEMHWRRLRERYGRVSRPGLVTRALGEMRAVRAGAPPSLPSADPPLFLTDRRAFHRLAPAIRRVGFEGLVSQGKLFLQDALVHDGVSFEGLGQDPTRTALFRIERDLGPIPYFFDGVALVGDRPFGRSFDSGGGFRFKPLGEAVAVGFDLTSLGTIRNPRWALEHPLVQAAAPDLWKISARQSDRWTSHHAATPPDGWAFAGFVAQEPIHEVVLRPGETCYPMVQAVYVG